MDTSSTEQPATLLPPSHQTIAGWVFVATFAVSFLWVVSPKAAIPVFFGRENQDRIVDSTVPTLCRLFGNFGVGIALSVAFAIALGEESREDPSADHRRQAIALCIVPRMMYTVVYVYRGFHGLNHPDLDLTTRKACIFLVGFCFPTYSLATGALNPWAAGIFFAIKSAVMGSFYYCYPSRFFTPSALVSAEEEFIVRRGAMYTFISFVWILTFQTVALELSTAIGAAALTWGLICCHLIYAEGKWGVVNGLLIASTMTAFAIAAVEFA